MRIGIIGTGKHGSRYANHIVRDIEGLELTAISRRSLEGSDQGTKWDCSWYDNWQELVVDDRVDAVIAVVPPVLNPDIARACAEAGKPLLIEKPLAVSSHAAREIMHLFAGRNLALTVGQTLRYNQIIRGLRDYLPEIGSLYSLSANQRLEPSSLSWHEDPLQAGAGVSFHTAVHIFDAIRFITGLEIRRVMAVSRKHVSSTLEDVLAVLLEMDKDIVGTIDCSKVGHARTGRFEFIGEKGQLHGDQVHNILERIHNMKVERLETGEPANTIFHLLQDWKAFLAGQAANPVPAEEGLAALRLCEACLTSSRTGNWVEVNETEKA